jgi:pSer/pThr/pTyr-binding forkhead associated (FHA) protein
VITCLEPSNLSLLAEPEPHRFRVQYLVEHFEGPILGQTLNVDSELVIGRDAEADLRLQGRLISRRHVLVRAVASGLELQDISVHGTLVDGVPLQRARRRIDRECNLLVGCVRVWLRRVLPGE